MNSCKEILTGYNNEDYRIRSISEEQISSYKQCMENEQQSITGTEMTEIEAIGILGALLIGTIILIRR